MSYRLPALSDILLKDFIYFDERENAEEKIKEIVQQKTLENPPSFIFYHKAYELYFCPIDTLLQSHCTSIPRIHTRAVKINTPLEEVIDSMSTYEAVLVMDNTQQAAGYITSNALMQVIYKSFQYVFTYFETMIETTDASVSIIDKDMKTIVWTKGAEDIFSIKQEEILGNPITEHFQMDMLEIINTLKTGKSVYRSQHQPRPDLFVLINTNPIILNNEIVGAVAAETDITSQVRLNKELFNATTKVFHLEQEMEKLKASTDPFHNIKGTSDVLQNTKEKIKKIGATKATALILGESGVGKELFAKAIHEISESPKAPFIPINCGAIPPALFESELFGYVKGAFSGADQKGKIGKVALASGGTLFLDEIGELPLDMQVKLLRLLQEKRYFAVGGTEQLEANCRIIAATNRNLEERINEGKFREDLYYRLNIITIKIPPLRERIEDIIELTHSFLYEFSIRYNKVIEHIPNKVMQELLQYHWPGNVRELRNTIERLVVFSSGEKISVEDLPFRSKAPHDQARETNYKLQPNMKSLKDSISNDHKELNLPLEKELNLYEKQVILKVLSMENGNKLSAAKKLGISRATLYNKLNKLNIN